MKSCIKFPSYIQPTRSSIDSSRLNVKTVVSRKTASNFPLHRQWFSQFQLWFLLSQLWFLLCWLWFLS